MLDIYVYTSVLLFYLAFVLNIIRIFRFAVCTLLHNARERPYAANNSQINISDERNAQICIEIIYHCRTQRVCVFKEHAFL